MLNKKPIILSLISQVVLLILILGTTNLFLKTIMITLIVTSEILIFKALVEEKKWGFVSWYTFFCMTAGMILIIVMIISSESNLRNPLMVEMIGVILLNAIIVSLSKKTKKKLKKLPKITPPKMAETKKEEAPKIEVVNYNIDYEKPNKHTTKKSKKITKKNVFVAAKNGNKYHRLSCRLIKKTKKNNLNMFTSKKAANKKGLTACGVCIK
ncbi:MAG: hypothetical protein ABIC91_07765 [Nanoarchaeota archaeon]|nr:hypothetical protein [Nanoarchaeota archaeon]MBU1031248.1 hypothetical protein [Nanoarchaeota archaeon]MBU1849589.1 hypothetical protein [Nanoarchaeota archaeon]